MTREEALQILDTIPTILSNSDEDCISRQVVLDEMNIRRDNGDMITAGFIKKGNLSFSVVEQ